MWLFSVQKSAGNQRVLWNCQWLLKQCREIAEWLNLAPVVEHSSCVLAQSTARWLNSIILIPIVSNEPAPLKWWSHNCALNHVASDRTFGSKKSDENSLTSPFKRNYSLPARSNKHSLNVQQKPLMHPGKFKFVLRFFLHRRSSLQAVVVLPVAARRTEAAKLFSIVCKVLHIMDRGFCLTLYEAF